MSKEQRATVPILFIGFITSFSMSTVLPFLVFVVKDYGGDGVMYGILGATYPLFEMIGAPILGGWSDRIGRKKVLLISHFGSFLSWIIFAGSFFLSADSHWAGLSLPLIVLFGSRVLDGITGGNIAVANAYLSDITPDEDNTKNFGRMAAASGLGFIIGPALAGVLGATSLGYLLPVLVAMGISATGLIFIYFMPDAKSVREELKLDYEDCKGYAEAHQTRIPLRRALKLPNIPMMLLLYFLIYLVFNLFYTSFPLYAEADLRWSSATIGIYFSVLSGLMIIIQLFVLPAMTKRFRPVTLLAGGLLVLSAYFYLVMVEEPVTLFAALAFFAIGNGLMWPAFLGLLSQIAGKDNQGTIQGYGSSAGALASVIGLIIGGLLFSLMGKWTFIFTGIGLGLIAVISLSLAGIPQNRISEKNDT